MRRSTFLRWILASSVVFGSASLAGCSDTVPPQPRFVSIDPEDGPTDLQTLVVIHGFGFPIPVTTDFSAKSAAAQNTIIVRLGPFDLIEPKLVSSTEISARVPAHLPEGVYDLQIVDWVGHEIRVPQIYTVRKTTCTDFNMQNTVDCGGCRRIAGCDCTEAGACMPTCGDQAVIPPEACDDGNTDDGDGCSAGCRIEPGFRCDGAPSICSSTCGDGSRASDEDCDDANTNGGDGCAGDCTIEFGFTCTSTLGATSSCSSICGNGLIGPGETCDDGNATAGDGCSDTCNVELGWFCPGQGNPCIPICGDGLRRGTETSTTGCDDANFFDGDGCGRDCTREPGWACDVEGVPCLPVCGDGTLVGGETCDDGNASSGDGCDAACRLEPGWFCPAVDTPCEAICADGLVVGNETCDDRNLASGDGCDWRCQKEPGWVCPTADHIGGSCLEDCGDGQIVGQERCDDGNTLSNDGCSSVCQLEPGWVCDAPNTPCLSICGDGLLVGLEGCDDGNPDPGDGCSPVCTVETHWTCPTPNAPCVPLCGDGFILPGEQCDDGNTSSSDGCSSTCTLEPGFHCATAGLACAPICGDHLVVAGEQCDDGNFTTGDGCDAACRVESGWQCPTGQPCAPICGDGVIIAGRETCDDGNATAGDGCSTSCQIEAGWQCPNGANCREICGDGLRVGTEECDDHNLASSDGCSSSCRLESGYECPTPGQPCRVRCGDGIIITPVESCDDGNNGSGDGCSSSCRLEPGFTCTTPGVSCAAICGDGLVVGTETCDDHNTTAADGCSSSCRLEPGYVCPTPGSACHTVCGDGVVAGAETCDDRNTTAGDGCSSACALETGWTCTTAGVPCTPICGDGRVLGAEGCDDGNTAPGDGCSSGCVVEAGYACPTPNRACNTICGDGLRVGAEQCDDHNLTPGDGCTATCTIEPGYACPVVGNPCLTVCGDGIQTPNEECDDHNILNVDGGDSSCTLPRCGNTIVDTGEECDDGNNTNGDGCDVNCTFPRCGNGIVDAGEACDDGNVVNGDGCENDCTVTPSCTDDVQNQGETGVDCGGPCSATCPTITVNLRPDQVVPVSGSGSRATCTVVVGGSLHSFQISCTHALVNPLPARPEYVGYNPTSIQILRGAIGANGTVVRTMTTLTSPTTQRFTLTPAEATELMSGGWYVLMSSLGFPNGDVRGQIATTVRFPLTTSSVVPPVTNSLASGSCVAYLTPDRTSATISCNHSQFNPAPNGASIMRGAPGTNGTLVAAFGNGLTPINRTTTLNAADIPDLMAGNLYLIVTTAALPNGALRGQIAQSVDAAGAGNQAVPQTPSTATSRCRALLAPDGVTLRLSCTHNVANVTSAALLRGEPWSTGALVEDLGNGASPINATVTLTPADAAEFQAGHLSVDIRSGAYLSGEVRAQLATNVSVLADGRQALPETHLGRSASCNVHLVPAETNLMIECTHDITDVTIAHFHIGNGAIAAEYREPRFPNPASPIVATQPLLTTDVSDYLNGYWYLHFHSASSTEPNGVHGGPGNLEGWEARGQVADTYEFVLNGPQMVPPSAATAVVHCYVFLGFLDTSPIAFHCEHSVDPPLHSYLRRGAVGTNGTTIQPMTVEIYTLNHSDALTWIIFGGGAQTVSDIRAGNAYVEWDTPNIRGQIVKNCPTPGLACNSRCGDGVILAGVETCDDGNATSGDGCSSTCQIEQGFTCGAPNTACFTVCGDGVRGGTEACDDGNLRSGDGCSSVCALELGWLCPGTGGACNTVCGDGLVAGAEACDDHNTTGADGCSLTCAIEAGFTCPTAGAACLATCGDGLRVGTEGCDDRNTAGGDGCSSACVVELGYTCPTPGSACVTVCGDGVRSPNEECDDGNRVNYDGCDNDCRLTCGNGMVNAGEQCDDGNHTNGDTCESDCTTPRCGNTIIDAGEQCDDGNTANGDTCEGDCTLPRCGNAIVDIGEICDDGNTTNGDGCENDCTVTPTCTDDLQNQGETGVDCGGPCAATCPTVTVALRPEQVVPASASGSHASCTVVVGGSQRSFQITCTHALQNPTPQRPEYLTYLPTSIQIVNGAIGANGTVVRTLATLTSPTTQRFTISPAEAAQLLGGGWYVLMSSLAFPNGDVRGQIASAVRFPLLPRYVAPAVTGSVYSGSCTSYLNPGRTSAVLTCTHSIVAPAPTSGALMRGAPGMTGTLVQSFGTGTTPINQTITLAGADLADYLAGNMYVTVATAPHPGGELRGQVAQVVESRGAGNQAVPSTASTASAYCVSYLAPDGVTLSLTCTHDVANVTSAALLRGAPWATGTQILALGAGTSPITGQVTLTPADAAELQAGRLSVDIRSGAYLSGEVRAQLATNFSVLADGRQGLPAVSTTRSANCNLHLVPSEESLLIECTHNVTDITTAHFHVGFGSIDGTYRMPLFPNLTSPFTVTQPLMTTDVADILNGRWYLHFHSVSCGGGLPCTPGSPNPAAPNYLSGWELRGQVAELFDLTLTGGEFVPPSGATAVVHCFVYVGVAEQATVAVRCDHTTDPLHVYLKRGARGANGTLVTTLNMEINTLNGADDLTGAWGGGSSAILQEIRSGNAYLEFDTPNIRAQIAH